MSTEKYVCADCGHHQLTMTACEKCHSVRVITTDVAKELFGEDYKKCFDVVTSSDCPVCNAGKIAEKRYQAATVDGHILNMSSALFNNIQVLLKEVEPVSEAEQRLTIQAHPHIPSDVIIARGSMQVTVMDYHTCRYLESKRVPSSVLVTILTNILNCTKIPYTVIIGDKEWSYTGCKNENRILCVDSYTNSDEVIVGLEDDENLTYSLSLSIEQGSVDDLESILANEL